ncbi:MAG: hypothetical protein ACYDC9_05290 [Dermatophilaceae bacterium]
MKIDGMEVLVRSDGCDGRNCPTIYRKDEGSFVIQGYGADHLFSSELPEGEHAVEVSVELVRKLAAMLH